MSPGNCNGSGVESKAITGTCAVALPLASNSSAKACLIMRSPRSVLRPAGFVHRDGRARADAHDLHDHFLVLGAVPVDLVRVVYDDAPRRHRGRRLLFELRARAHPPRALDDGDVAR